MSEIHVCEVLVRFWVLDVEELPDGRDIRERLVQVRVPVADRRDIVVLRDARVLRNISVRPAATQHPLLSVTLGSLTHQVATVQDLIEHQGKNTGLGQ